MPCVHVSVTFDLTLPVVSCIVIHLSFFLSVQMSGLVSMTSRDNEVGVARFVHGDYGVISSINRFGMGAIYHVVRSDSGLTREFIDGLEWPVNRMDISPSLVEIHNSLEMHRITLCHTFGRERVMRDDRNYDIENELYLAMNGPAYSLAHYPHYAYHL